MRQTGAPGAQSRAVRENDSAEGGVACLATSLASTHRGMSESFPRKAAYAADRA